MLNIFISYQRQSETIVKTLAKDIQALGHTAWFDQDLSGGQDWWDRILSRVRDCDVFVIVLSPEALNSTACTREYKYAANLAKLVLPILVSEEVSTKLLPPTLSKIQFVDYKKQDRDSAFRLAKALTTLPSPEPLPEVLPDPPKAPISYLGNLTEQIETKAALSYEQQSVLLFDLKRSLRDSETTDDARTLLGRLRKRRDLLATIAEELDELLASTERKSQDPFRASSLEQYSEHSSDDITQQVGKKDGEEEKIKQPASRSKLIGLIAILLIIGLHVGIGILLVFGAEDITYYWKSSNGISSYRLREVQLVIVLAGWAIAFVISAWLWNTVRRANKGQEKATQRFQSIFKGGVSPRYVYLVLTLVVLAFNILVGLAVFDDWSRVW